MSSEVEGGVEGRVEERGGGAMVGGEGRGGGKRSRRRGKGYEYE